MTDAVIQGTFADLKTVKTRSVVQLIIEVPIEQGEEVVRLFGFPQPAAEISVAVARLATTEKPAKHRRFYDLKPTQQAAILCNDRQFQQWTDSNDENEAAHWIRTKLNLESRAELNANKTAALGWNGIVTQFKQDTGQMAIDPRS